MHGRAFSMLGEIHSKLESELRILENNRDKNIEVNMEAKCARITDEMYNIQNLTREILFSIVLDDIGGSRLKKIERYSRSILNKIKDKNYDSMIDYLELITDELGILDRHGLYRYIQQHRSNYSYYLGQCNIDTDEIDEAHNEETMRSSFGLFANEIQDIIADVANSKNRKESPVNSKVLIMNFDHAFTVLNYEHSDVHDRVDYYATYDDTFNISMDLRNKLTKAAVGNRNSYTITNDAFDVVYLRNVEGNNEYTYNGSQRVYTGAHTDISKAMRYVKVNGVVMILLPRYALTKKALTAIFESGTIDCIYRQDIADNPEDTYNKQEMFLVVARKVSKRFTLFYSSDTSYAEDVMNFNTLLHNDDELDNYILNVGDKHKYDVNNTSSSNKNINIFKGSSPDKTALYSLLTKSSAFEYKVDNNIKTLTPLLPFNNGQIGQVLASGRLDGIITEKSGTKHIIRGRVYPVCNSKIEYDDVQAFSNGRGSAKQIATYLNSHAVEINVLLGNGTFKTVAASSGGDANS